MFQNETVDDHSEGYDSIWSLFLYSIVYRILGLNLFFLVFAFELNDIRDKVFTPDRFA